MSRTPALISGLLLLAGAAAIAVITLCPSIALTPAQYIQSTTGIVATTGALVSATFVVSSYRQSIRTFHEAYRPQLLVQVESQFEAQPDSEEKIPVSIIHYRNISNNQFNDLTLHLTIDAFGGQFSLDDLFTPKMTMPGQDVRFRRIRPVQLLNESGLYLNTEIRDQPAPRLSVEYEHTYAGRTHKVLAQQYTWNVLLQLWEIA